MKVLWHKHGIKEATWELEEAMRKYYPNLFIGNIFGDEIPKGESCNSSILAKSEQWFWNHKFEVVKLF